jgi:hypothetical protein
LHDINTLDKLGIPGLVVATTEFKPAAAAQSKSLGFEPAMIWLPHPIQNRTTDELAQLADESLAAILSTLTGNGKAG